MISTIVNQLTNKKYKQFCIFFCLSFISFSLWLVAFWPGIVNYDSLNIWNQVLNGHYTDWHPYVYTYLVRIMALFSLSPAPVAILQILISSILGSYIFLKLYQKIEKKWIVWLAFIGYITSVTIGLYNITLWTDIIFAQLIAYWGILLYSGIIDGKKIAHPVYLVFLGMLLFFTSTIRHNGIIFLLLIPFFFYMAKVMKLKTVAIFSLIAISFYLVSRTVVPHYFHIKMTHPLIEISQIQLIGAVLSSNNIIYDETSNPPLNLIDKALSRPELTKGYKCRSIDPLVSKMNLEILEDPLYKREFNKIFFPLIIHNFPQVLEDRVCMVSSAFLKPTGTPYQNDLEFENSEPEFPYNLGLKQGNRFPILRGIYLKVIHFQELFIMNPLLIPLLLFLFGLTFYKKNKPLFFYSLVIIIQVPFLILLLPSDSFRYFYFLHFGFFFLIPMFFIKPGSAKTKT